MLNNTRYTAGVSLSVKGRGRCDTLCKPV